MQSELHWIGGRPLHENLLLQATLVSTRDWECLDSKPLNVALILPIIASAALKSNFCKGAAPILLRAIVAEAAHVKPLETPVDEGNYSNTRCGREASVTMTEVTCAQAARIVCKDVTALSYITEHEQLFKPGPSGAQVGSAKWALRSGRQVSNKIVNDAVAPSHKGSAVTNG